MYIPPESPEDKQKRVNDFFNKMFTGSGNSKQLENITKEACAGVCAYYKQLYPNKDPNVFMRKLLERADTGYRALQFMHDTFGDLSKVNDRAAKIDLNTLSKIIEDPNIFGSVYKTQLQLMKNSNWAQEIKNDAVVKPKEQQETKISGSDTIPTPKAKAQTDFNNKLTFSDSVPKAMGTEPQKPPKTLTVSEQDLERAVNSFYEVIIKYTKHAPESTAYAFMKNFLTMCREGNENGAKELLQNTFGKNFSTIMMNNGNDIHLIEEYGKRKDLHKLFKECESAFQDLYYEAKEEESPAKPPKP